jgi:hypothetical protein
MEVAAVAEPSSYHIPMSDWMAAERRAAFEAGFLRLIDLAGTTGRCRVLWSDGIDALLFGDTTQPGWLKDEAWRRYYLALYGQRLAPVLQRVGAGCESPGAVLEPDVTNRPDDDPYKGEFVGLAGSAAQSGSPVAILPGYAALDVPTVDITGADGSLVRAAVAKCAPDILSLLLATDFWPASPRDVDRIRQAIRISMARLGLATSFAEVDRAQFEPAFVGGLAQERTGRAAIAKAIAKRLAMPQQAASQDKGLKDEPWRGSGSRRRFRIDRSRRIHYSYGATGCLVFEEYLPAGRHDRTG